jgi:hypothetical protein
VTLLPDPDQGKAHIGISWHTGATDEIVTARAPRSYDARRTPPEIVDMIRQRPTRTPATTTWPALSTPPGTEAAARQITRIGELGTPTSYDRLETSPKIA